MSQNDRITLEDTKRAARVIAGIADNTPLVQSRALTNTSLWIKLETKQPIGAFKLRGALNAIANLPEGAKGVVTASTGNHGRAVAYGARDRGLQAVIAMSTLVPQNKINAIKALGAAVHISGESQDEALVDAIKLANERNYHLIPPFDDLYVIAGQSTIGQEIIAAQPDLDAVLVPLSGGGLAAGVGMAVKSQSPQTRVIGVSMERGAAMAASLAAGKPVEVDELPTLADSLGGGIGLDNRYSFAMCQRYLDDVILVSEAEIRDAIVAHYQHDNQIIEGAAAVGLAAILSGKFEPKGACATILSGRNIDPDLHQSMISGDDITIGDLTIKGRAHDQ